MHPRIERLYIHNYRSFVNFELRPEGRSLLLGYNGCGKSSIFDVLAAIQSLTQLNEEVTTAFPIETLGKLTSAHEQKFELDITSEWSAHHFSLGRSH